MSTDFNPNQKLSMVIKHQNDINYTSDEKYWFSETISGGHIQLSRELWIDDDKIIWNDPEQSIANGVIEQVSITLTEDATVADQMCWIADDNGTQLDNWVHPLHFGTKYAITLQRHNGVKIPTDSSWIFNYKSGVLTFAVPPSSINLTMPFKIIGYRYIGDFFRASTPTSFIGLQDVFASGAQSGQIIAAISSSGFSNTHLTVPYIEEHINYQDIHLTPEEIDHSRLMNTSGYTHTEINDHINDLGAHFYPPAINHDELMNASGHYTHEEIDEYINTSNSTVSMRNITLNNFVQNGNFFNTNGWTEDTDWQSEFLIIEQGQFKSGYVGYFASTSQIPIGKKYKYSQNFFTSRATEYTLKYRSWYVSKHSNSIAKIVIVNNIGTVVYEYSLLLSNGNPNTSFVIHNIQLDASSSYIIGILVGNSDTSGEITDIVIGDLQLIENVTVQESSLNHNNLLNASGHMSHSEIDQAISDLQSSGFVYTDESIAGSGTISFPLSVTDYVNQQISSNTAVNGLSPTNYLKTSDLLNDKVWTLVDADNISVHLDNDELQYMAANSGKVFRIQANSYFSPATVPYHLYMDFITGADTEYLFSCNHHGSFEEFSWKFAIYDPSDDSLIYNIPVGTYNIQFRNNILLNPYTKYRFGITRSGYGSGGSPVFYLSDICLSSISQKKLSIFDYGDFQNNPTTATLFYVRSSGHIYANILGADYQLDQQSVSSDILTDNSLIGNGTSGSLLSIASTIKNRTLLWMWNDVYPSHAISYDNDTNILSISAGYPDDVYPVLTIDPTDRSIQIGSANFNTSAQKFTVSCSGNLPSNFGQSLQTLNHQSLTGEISIRAVNGDLVGYDIAHTNGDIALSNIYFGSGIIAFGQYDPTEEIDPTKIVFSIGVGPQYGVDNCVDIRGNTIADGSAQYTGFVVGQYFATLDDYTDTKIDLVGKNLSTSNAISIIGGLRNTNKALDISHKVGTNTNNKYYEIGISNNNNDTGSTIQFRTESFIIGNSSRNTYGDNITPWLYVSTSGLTAPYGIICSSQLLVNASLISTELENSYIATFQCENQNISDTMRLYVMARSDDEGENLLSISYNGAGLFFTDNSIILGYLPETSYGDELSSFINLSKNGNLFFNLLSFYTNKLIAYGTGGATSTCIGVSADASKTYSIAIGYNAKATSSSYAIAIGYNSQAITTTDTGTIAFGNNCLSNSRNAIAIGNTARARGKESLSIGINTNADHNGSTAIGVDATTDYANQMVLGSAITAVNPKGIVRIGSTAYPSTAALSIYRGPSTDGKFHIFCQQSNDADWGAFFRQLNSGSWEIGRGIYTEWIHFTHLTGNLDGTVSINSTTASTTTTTGALKVAGGLGVAGTVTAGGYKASDGSAGVTADNVIIKGTDGVWHFMEFKNGILTDYDTN